MKDVRKTIRLSAEMAEAIDRARGDVSWSRWVELALKRALAGDEPVQTPVRPPVAQRAAVPARTFNPRPKGSS